MYIYIYNKKYLYIQDAYKFAYYDCIYSLIYIYIQLCHDFILFLIKYNYIN